MRKRINKRSVDALEPGPRTICLPHYVNGLRYRIGKKLGWHGTFWE